MLDATKAGPATDPSVSAAVANLRYVSDQTPGIRRLGAGRTFRYLNPNGRAIRDSTVLNRIKSLAIPPAWRDVWISPYENSHLQAVGRDARGRKQYRYHSRWRRVRDETKYHRMIDFGKALPHIRARVAKDLRATGLSKEKVLATIVRLLETTYIRVGNYEYTKENSSFGLTTLRDHHVNVRGSNVSFFFRGKSGVRHAISIQDRHLARIVRHCRDLPGYELFQYVAEDGSRGSIDSSDVNDYLREISGKDFTSKDFRTWAGTVLAAVALCQSSKFSTSAQARKNLLEAIKSVAGSLGNTPAVCRKCYIHPAIIDGYMDKSLARGLKATGRKTRLSSEEAAVLCFLKNQSKKRAKESKETLEEKLRRSIKAKARGSMRSRRYA